MITFTTFETALTHSGDAPEGWYVQIDRQYSPVSLAVGPYRSEEVAVSAMTEALLIDGFCETDCLDAYVVPASGLDAELELAVIDQDDPYHYGPAH